MGIQIIVPNTDDLSPLDRQILAIAAGDVKVATVETVAEKAVVNKPAKKTAPAKAKPAPEPVEEEEAPEPVEEDEDLVGDGPTMKDAVARATELVSANKGAEVKSALGDLGVKRVSGLDDNQIADFLAALSDA